MQALKLKSVIIKTNSLHFMHYRNMTCDIQVWNFNENTKIHPTYKAQFCLSICIPVCLCVCASILTPLKLLEVQASNLPQLITTPWSVS